MRSSFRILIHLNKSRFNKTSSPLNYKSGAALPIPVFINFHMPSESVGFFIFEIPRRDVLIFLMENPPYLPCEDFASGVLLVTPSLVDSTLFFLSHAHGYFRPGTA